MTDEQIIEQINGDSPDLTGDYDYRAKDLHEAIQLARQDERTSLLKDVVTTSLSAEEFAEKIVCDIDVLAAEDVTLEQMKLNIMPLLESFSAHAVAKDRERLIEHLKFTIEFCQKGIDSGDLDDNVNSKFLTYGEKQTCQNLLEWLNEKSAD